jgi:serine/threonine protein kinase
MANPTNPAQRGAAEPRLAGGGARDTVLLSDIPGAEAAPPAPTLESSPKFNLSSSVLAALGQRYEILAEAGHGSMGNVYKARDRETGETVALKLLKPEIASDQAMMDRFKNELLFARKITHKNVCRVHEFNRVDGVAYTSMEFVEGESLRSVLNRFGALSLKKATDLALQICSGLKEAHAQGIVHRDLKPENVMIDNHGNLKLMDFGIARSMEALTRQTGAMVGTPAYMAPEQVSGTAVDYRTDIYSLGLMLYEMFTGKPAFTAENAIAVALKQMREDPIPPSAIEPSLSLSIERAILKCLEKAPAKRFQSVAELESALQNRSLTGTDPKPSVTSLAAVTAKSLPPRAILPPPSVARPASAKSRGRVFAWLLVFAIALAGGAAQRWRSVTDAANAIPPPAPSPAPLPPSIAYEVTPKAPAAVAGSEPKTPEPISPSAVTPHEPAKSLAAKQPSVPDVFPKMETAPKRHPLPDPSAWIAAQKALAKQQNQSKQPGMVYLRTGHYFRAEKAQSEAKKIRDMGLPATVKTWRMGKGDVYVTLCGPISAGGAAAVASQLKSSGFREAERVSAQAAQ